MGALHHPAPRPGIGRACRRASFFAADAQMRGEGEFLRQRARLGVSAKRLPRYLREWSHRFDRRNLPDGLDGSLIRRAVECATITCDRIKAGSTPGGATRVRRPLATVAQPALAGWGDKINRCRASHARNLS
jgi:hypothetical protein